MSELSREMKEPREGGLGVEMKHVCVTRNMSIMILFVFNLVFPTLSLPFVK